MPSNLLLTRRRMHVAAVAAAIVVLLAGALLFWLLWPTYRPVPDLDFPPARTAAEAVRQDLAQLRHVMAYDRSFTPATRAEFDRRVAELERRAADLDRAALEAGVAWAVAAADNAHTSARSATRGLQLNSLPLRFLWFKEGLFVVKATPPYRDLLGARVVAIDDRPAAAAAASLRRYVGGPARYAGPLTPFMLASPQFLHAAGLARRADEARLRLELGGRVVERRIGAEPLSVVPPPGDQARPLRDLSPVDDALDRRRWIHLHDGRGRRLPLYLQRPDTNYWATRIEPLDAVYVQVNLTRDQADKDLPRFLDDVLAEVRRTTPRAMIVDLRFNVGGDYSLITGFTSGLPAAMAPGSRLFVVTSPVTFSAGIVFATQLKAYATRSGLSVSIAGEEAGDRRAYWGEGDRARLPNSGIMIRYATAYHDHRRGCAWHEARKCFLFDYFFARGVAESIAPDLSAPATFAAYRSLRDPALERIARALAAPPRASSAD